MDLIMTIDYQDETLSILLDGKEVGYANHDEHGWSGIGALEDMAENIARVLRIEVERA